MRPELIRDALRAKPFRRLRVFLSDGSSHEVPHPDFVVVTTHQVIVASDVNAHGVPRRTVAIDPIHVTRIEPADDSGGPPPAGGNGDH